MTAEPDTSATKTGNYFVANYPPFSTWRVEDAHLATERLARPPAAGTPLGLYVHIPFCRKRCDFCYFRVYYFHLHIHFYYFSFLLRPHSPLELHRSLVAPIAPRTL